MTRTTHALLLAALVSAQAGAAGLSGGVATAPGAADPFVTGGSQFASLLRDLEPSAFDVLQASLAVEDKAAAASWAPFLPMRDYYDFLSETRLQIGLKDGKPTAGVALRWNPYSPRSARGAKIWAATSQPSFQDETAKLRKLREAVLTYEDEMLAIEDPSIPGLRDKHLDLQRLAEDLGLNPEEEQQRRKNAADAGKALQEARTTARNAIRSRHLENIETLEKTLAAAPTDEKRRRILLEIEEQIRRATLAGPALATLESNIAVIEKGVSKKSAAAVAAFEEKLFGTAAPLIALSYSAVLFPTLGSSFADANGNGLDDNAHSLAERTLSLSAMFRLGVANQLSVAVARSGKRAGAEAGQPFGERNVASLTYARRIAILDPNYASSDDYLSSLFVPSIAAGLSVEGSHCVSELADCTDKARNTVAVSPFVDVKLKKTAQFRIGVTWKRLTESTSASRDLAVLATLGFQLGLPGK